MDLNEAFEADWIIIRAILKEQLKSLAQKTHPPIAGQSAEAAHAQAVERAHRLIAECESIITIYSRRA